MSRQSQNGMRIVLNFLLYVFCDDSLKFIDTPQNPNRSLWDSVRVQLVVTTSKQQLSLDDPAPKKNQTDSLLKKKEREEQISATPSSSKVQTSMNHIGPPAHHQAACSN